MKPKICLLNTILAVLLTLGLLAALLVRTFQPAAVLPKWDIPGLTAISLAALLLERFLGSGPARRYPGSFLQAAVSFGLLPWAAGFSSGPEVWTYALWGGGIFTAAAWVFDSVTERIAPGRCSGAAAAVSALGIYLAVQAFSGML